MGQAVDQTVDGIPKCVPAHLQRSERGLSQSTCLEEVKPSLLSAGSALQPKTGPIRSTWLRAHRNPCGKLPWLLGNFEASLWLIRWGNSKNG